MHPKGPSRCVVDFEVSLSGFSGTYRILPKNVAEWKRSPPDTLIYQQINSSASVLTQITAALCHHGFHPTHPWPTSFYRLDNPKCMPELLELHGTLVEKRAYLSRNDFTQSSSLARQLGST